MSTGRSYIVYWHSNPLSAILVTDSYLVKSPRRHYNKAVLSGSPETLQALPENLQGGMSRAYILKENGIRKFAKAPYGDSGREEYYLRRTLAHKNILPVDELRPTESRAYPYLLISRYLERGNLRDRNLNLTTADRVGCLANIADALAHTHSRGIVHADFKPEAVMFDKEDTPYLVDFGNAFPILPGNSLGKKQSLEVLASSLYAAPELFAPGVVEIDQASDVYAFCVTAAESLYNIPYTTQVWNLRTAVGEGKRLRAPKGIEQSLATALTNGLSPQRSARPKMEEIAEKFDEQVRILSIQTANV